MKRAKHVEFMTFTEAFEMLNFMSLFEINGIVKPTRYTFHNIFIYEGRVSA